MSRSEVLLGLTMEERGALAIICDLAEDRDADCIPDDDHYIAGWLGCSARKWRLIRAALLVKGKVEDGKDRGRAILRPVVFAAKSPQNVGKVSEKSPRNVPEISPICDTKVNEIKRALAPTHVEDITSISENNLNHTTPYCAWPLSEKPNRAELDELQVALREAAGEAIDPTATRLLILAPILALGKSGEGPPCDLEADILPVIRARSAGARKHSVRGWNFYVSAIREARDQRLSGAPKVVAVDFSPRGQSPPYQSASERASAAAAEGRRLFLEGQNK